MSGTLAWALLTDIKQRPRGFLKPLDWRRGGKTAVSHINNILENYLGRLYWACLNLSIPVPMDVLWCSPVSEGNPVFPTVACATQNWERNKGDKISFPHLALEYFSLPGHSIQTMKTPIHIAVWWPGLASNEKRISFGEAEYECFSFKLLWSITHWWEARLLDLRR